MSERPALHGLAAQAGILDGYRSALDGSLVATRDATREALLAAMGLDASSEAAAARASERLAAEREARWLDPVCVVSADSPVTRRLALRAGHGIPAGTPVRLTIAAEGIENEGMERRELEACIDEAGDVALPVPAGAERWLGRLEIAATLALPDGPRELRQLRYLVPPRCTSPEERLGQDEAFGIWANLYSVRSESNWGFGNLGDLAALARLAGREGAAFVGVNPLHALSPGALCPYLPSSRLFRNPLYLDPGRIPELACCPEAGRLIESEGFGADLARLRAAPNLDAGAVGALLDAVLSALHRCFAAGATGPERARAFERYQGEEGDALRDFASFSALADHFAARGVGRDWRRWPAAFRSPDSAAVRAFRQRNASEVQRHAWIQFELDRQLGEVADEARAAGLRLGLYTDMALGSDPGGSDAWTQPELLVPGVRVGAPPDDFSPDGQEWGFSPAAPAALRDDGYRSFTRLLRASLRHAGALRLDHAMGLRRLFWVPEGRPPFEGAYVRYPDEELFGLVALESLRHRAVVVAEDLGTLPEGFAEQLQDRGILSSRVLLFEREGTAFRPANHYPRRCLVTANTHDLPPLAALAGDADLALRRRAGHIRDDAALGRARATRATDRAALGERLRGDGWLAEGRPDAAALAAAVTAFLSSTPACLVGLALDDLAAECEPINLPGVTREHHPSWARRQSATLEELWQADPARACLSAVPTWRRVPRPDQAPS